MKAVPFKALFFGGLILAATFHAGVAGAQQPRGMTLDEAQAGAAKGDAEAEFYLAKIYAGGMGVPQDYTKAAEYYQKAADQGYGKAENNLGILYLQGRGVKQDQTEAIKWLEKAATQGLSLSQTTLASILINEEGASQQGLELYQKAAEQGEVNAQVRLGNVYYFGTNEVKKDNIEAAKWFRLAAAQGDASAENNLGVMNELGMGMPIDAKAAVDWFRKSAEQGYAKGESNYGRIYADGVGGVATDPAKAYAWMSMSAAQGEVTAENFLTEYTAGLKPAELLEGNRLIKEYEAEIAARPSPTPAH